eukprot:gnl/TRDRNA2_/TRDRNA2_168892_c0_seq1.p1 gnl/TRDRNA2_/TRDRNA2_168892_c0~~gnl/TRDRNA2_/TRDRNA2_168892_c0_seq1.p1  ORF type:complete len:381 (+),score=57.55 gnl/TRDRNA2_/TRDRNA2_168892_c0_seq1:173-1315(+)
MDATSNEAKESRARTRKLRLRSTNEYKGWAFKRHSGCPEPQSAPVVKPPLRLLYSNLGVLDDEATRPANLEPFPSHTVFLNIYDVGESHIFQTINQMSTVDNSVLMGGVFHAGTEVYGCEWAFGFSESGSGVSSVTPRVHPDHTYRATVPMGLTPFDEATVSRLIDGLSRKWIGKEYDVLHRNCLTFCNELCKELGVGSIPSWVDRAPRAASFVENTLRNTAEAARLTVSAGAEAAGLTAQFAGKLLADGSSWQEKRPSGVGDFIGEVRESEVTGIESVGSRLQQWWDHGFGGEEGDEGVGAALMADAIAAAVGVSTAEEDRNRDEFLLPRRSRSSSSTSSSQVHTESRSRPSDVPSPVRLLGGVGLVVEAGDFELDPLL